MANTFVNLPCVAGNGAGPAVDVSTFGATKTIAVQGNGSVFEPFVTIEIANDAAGVEWSTLTQFLAPGERTIPVAARWMRAVVSNYRGGGAPTVDVGGNTDGAQFATLAVPAGDGAGAATDVTALGLFKTVQVVGAFRGALIIEVSEDAGVSWAEAFAFQSQAPGIQSAVIAAEFMRVTRNGVPGVSPGTPTVNVGGAEFASGDDGVALSAGTQSVATGTVVFSNSNGVSFGMAGSSVVTASVAAIKSISGGTTNATGPGISFGDANNVSWGIAGNTITASIVPEAGIGLSAGTSSISTGTAVFSNSNGISFGLNGSTVTGSYNPFAATAAGGSLSAGTLVFSNSNGLAFGMNASTLTGSYSQSTSPNAIAVNAAGSVTAGTAVFSNSNNITFGINGSTITASASSPAETPFAVSANGGSQSTGTVSFGNANGVSFGYNAATITASYTQSTGVQAISAAGAAAASGTVIFSNAGNVSFGMAGQTITATVTTPAETPFAISAPGGSQSTGTVVFQGAGGIVLTKLAETVVVSVNAIRVISAGTTNATGSAISFADQNAISFGINGNTITGSFQAIKSVSVNNTVIASGGIAFTDSNGFSFGQLASTITMSMDAIRRVSAGTTNASGSGLSFDNANNISFGMNGNTITASVVPDAGIGLSAGASSIATGTVVFSNSNNVSFGLNGSTVTATVTTPAETPFAISAGTQSVSTGTMVFSDSNGMSFGMSGSSRITGSFAGIKSISGGTTRVTNGEAVFSNSNGVTFGVNGNTVTASVSAHPAISAWQNAPLNNQGIEVITNVDKGASAQISYQRVNVPFRITATRVDIPMYVSMAGATTQYGWAYHIGLYTMSGSTASLNALSAQSNLVTWGTASNSLNAGLRWRSASLANTWNVTPGDYLVGVAIWPFQDDTAGTISVQHYGALIPPSIAAAPEGDTNTPYFAQGVFSVTTNVLTLPASVHLTAIQQTATSSIAQPFFRLAGTF